MKIGILAPAAWRLPPRNYGPWELIAYNMAEGLVKRGHKVTVFATQDSKTRAKLSGIVPRPYREHPRDMLEDVWQALHLGFFFERADQFDLLHNHYNFLPLTYSRLVKPPLVTTIHGFTSKKILPVFQEYNKDNYYISISDADRDPSLKYAATVYNGINLSQFEFNPKPKNYLVFLGRVAREKGTDLAIKVAKKTGRELKIAAIIPSEEEEYWQKEIEPLIDGKQIQYLGPADPKMRNGVLKDAFASLHLVRFNEPFGLTMVEAMACGTPVIAMNRGSVPEIVLDGKSGYKVNNVDQASEAVEKIAKIRRKDCRRWVEDNFTLEKMAENYEKVYQKILSKNGKD